MGTLKWAPYPSIKYNPAMSSKSSDIKDGPEIEKDDLNSAEKILLMLIGAGDNEPVPGNLWVQKELFLISQDLPQLDEYFDFKPHLQGPFSETVNNRLEDVEFLGLINRDWQGICLSERGQQLVESIRAGTHETVLQDINETKSLLNDLSKDELLVYIYYTHEDMTTASLEKKGLEKKRKHVAEFLLNRGKVDKETAAQLAGVSESKLSNA